MSHGTWRPYPHSPGLLGAMLIFTAFPAFLIGIPVVRDLGNVGASEVATFMIVMPPSSSVGFMLSRG